MRILNGTGFKPVLIVLICSLALSCKSKKTLTNTSFDDISSAKSIIKAHYLNEIDFNTIRGKMKIDYSDGESSQGVSVSFRMKKDQSIWMSAPFGMVKVLITPERVSFYNKLENEYFDGDFSYLSAMLGTELDFEKVQNLLLGQAIFDLREQKYRVEVVNENYQLTPKSELELFQTLFEIAPKNFKIETQQLSQPLKKRRLDINYKAYQQINKWVLPSSVLITALEEGVKNIIELEYRNIEFDQKLSFPYKIPSGYKEIVLKKDDI